MRRRSKRGHAGLRLRAEALASSSSHSSVPKKLSHIALSCASPTVPIDGRTPASLQRMPNAMGVYWQPRSEWWTTLRSWRGVTAMFSASSTTSDPDALKVIHSGAVKLIHPVL